MLAHRQWGRRLLSPTFRGWRLASQSPAKSTRFEVTQGGTVVVDLRGLKELQAVEIVSAWQDFCTLETSAEMAGQFSTHFSAEHNSLTVSASAAAAASSSAPASAAPSTAAPTAPDPARLLRLTVPQSIDLDVSGEALALRMRNKIEGDVRVECSSGSVEVDKIRGMSLLFHCPGAALVVHKLLEGNLQVAAHSVRAKMINGDVVDIAAETTCSVEAMYLQQCHVTALGDVHIAALNGKAVVHSRHGGVKLGGIDGSFDVLAEQGSISLQINKLTPDTPSCAVATQGGITAQVDPEIQASVRCESQGIAGRARVTIVSDAFISSAQSHPQHIPTPGIVTGHLTGKSAALKRPSAGSAASSGKIDLRGAEAQALSGHGRTRAGGDRAADVAAAVDLRDLQARQALQQQQQQQDANGNTPSPVSIPTPPSTTTSATKTSTVSADSTHATQASPAAFAEFPEVPETADLTLTAHGHVRVETLSWFEAIRRKHGFKEGEGSTPPAVGRTATANARARELE